MKQKFLKTEKVEIPGVEEPKTDIIVTFRVIHSDKSKWKTGRKGRLIDKNGKKARYKIVHYKNGEGSLMIPYSFFSKSA